MFKFIQDIKDILTLVKILSTDIQRVEVSIAELKQNLDKEKVSHLTKKQQNKLK